MADRCEILILGAGVTGLGAAWRARELGRSFRILEASSQAGGLAASFRDDAGFTWDSGVHLHFSHYEKYDAVFESMFAEGEWHELPRRSAVRMAGQLIPYPLQLHVHRLPPELRWRCLSGWLEAARGAKRTAAHFRDWSEQTFGRGMSEMFLRPYNEKIWQTRADQLSAEWIGERVAASDLWESLRRMCFEEDAPAWGPNARFRYPKSGGSGELWRRVADTFSSEELRRDTPVVEIDPVRQTVTTSAGETIGYEALVSTIPLVRLGRMVARIVDIEACQSLRWTRTRLFGYGLRGPLPAALRERLWVYFPDPSTACYRATCLSNLSRHNVPDEGCWSMIAEVAETPGTPPQRDLFARVAQDLVREEILDDRATMISRWERTLEFGYPVPTLGRDPALERILGQLDGWKVYSRGRFGGWRYEVSNQDHSFLQGVEAVARIVCGRDELTLFRPGLVNSRKNPFPFPEWE